MNATTPLNLYHHNASFHSNAFTIVPRALSNFSASRGLLTTFYVLAWTTAAVIA